MDEIQTTGLKGLYNRITIFSHMQREEIYDITARIDEPLLGHRLSTNRVMLVSRTHKLLMTGQDQSKFEFLNLLQNHSGRISSKEEYNSLKLQFIPEYNTGTNKIGEGYRGIANKVMLTTRAECNVNTGHDLFPYEFTMMLLANSATKSDIGDTEGINHEE